MPAPLSASPSLRRSPSDLLKERASEKVSRAAAYWLKECCTVPSLFRVRNSDARSPSSLHNSRAVEFRPAASCREFAPPFSCSFLAAVDCSTARQNNRSASELGYGGSMETTSVAVGFSDSAKRTSNSYSPLWSATKHTGSPPSSKLAN